MKTRKIKPEILDRYLRAAVTSIMKELHQVNAGIRVTHISAESTDLQPSGISYHFSIDVQITGNPEPVVLDEKAPDV